MPRHRQTKKSGYSRCLPREIFGRYGRVRRAVRPCARPIQGLIRLPDVQIVAKAVAESRIVLTFDLDFGDILAVARTSTPSVVILRLRNQTLRQSIRGSFVWPPTARRDSRKGRSSSSRTTVFGSGDSRSSRDVDGSRHNSACRDLAAVI